MSDTAQTTVPDEQRCAWPGCTRRRAAERTAGSGRQKEYCLQADPPESGGGSVHNARNRWSSLRSAALRAAQHPADDAEDAGGAGGRGGGPAATGSADASVGHPGTGTGGGESAGSVRDELLFSATKKRASDLLEQARRQHAAATQSLRAERELYQRLGEQLTALADPASLDLEIAAIASRAGASVAQAEEDAARARRAQLAAERERDDAARLRAHADAAAEQLAADAEAAELALAERTAEFDLDRAAFVARAREAEELADRFRTAAAEAQATAAAAEARATADVIAAREQASGQIASARARADEAIAGARRETEEAMAATRHEAAKQVAAAQTRADASADRARRDVDAVRRETAAVIADANAASERARTEAAAARAAAADAQANTATASARADAAMAETGRARDEIGRLQDELRRLDAARETEIARLAAAHQAALESERGRAVRAETELDALRRAP
jgi:colicin import membrane protein